MIVLGADTHKRSHTIAAVAAATGELLGEQTVQVGAEGFAALLRWARGLDGERVWAIEDCRHVSGSFERFLIGRGERVLRVTDEADGATRARSARERGKSDSIDAIAVARAALREGLDALPAAQLDGPELDLRLLVDHRERLIRQRVALNNTLQWHLHDLWPELQLPGSSLFSRQLGRRGSRGGSRAPSRRCASASPATSCAASASSPRRSRRSSARSPGSSRTVAPQLLTEPGFGPLTAAKLVGEIAGASASPPTPSSPAPPASRRSRSAPARPTANASTAAATARSTPRSTASIVTRARCHPAPATTSPADAPKARPPTKRSAASSATSPATSGDCSSRPTRSRNTAITINFLT